MSTRGWTGVALDGTLVEHGQWINARHLGKPIEPMVNRVKGWLADNRPVRIFTARMYPLNRCIGPDDKRVPHGTWLDNNREDDCWEAIEAIRVFCVRHFGQVLPITNVKDFEMVDLWDDRCEQVETNTGRRAVDVAFEQGRAVATTNGEIT